MSAHLVYEHLEEHGVSVTLTSEGVVVLSAGSDDVSMTADGFRAVVRLLTPALDQRFPEGGR